MALRSAGLVLARAFAQVGRNLGVFASTQGLLTLAALLPLAALVYTAELVLRAPGDGGSPLVYLLSTPPLALLLGAALLASFTLGVLAFGLGLVVADALADGRGVDAFVAWDRVRARFRPLLLTQGLVFALALGPLFATVWTFEAFGEPGDWLLIPLVTALVAGAFVFLLGTSLSAPVSVLEERAAVECLRRSWRLTTGQKGAVLLALVAFALLAATSFRLAGEALEENVELGLLVLLGVLLLSLSAFTSLLVQMHRALREAAEVPPTP